MTVRRFFAPRLPLCHLPFTGVLLALLAGCAATPPAPANAPRAPVAASTGPSVISLPVTLDLGRAAAEVLRELPRPLLRHSQRRPLPVRMSSFSTTVAPEPGSCSVTALNCLARQSVRLLASDTLATAEAEVTQQLYLRELRLAMTGSRLTVVADVEVAVNTRLAAGADPLGATSCGRPRARLELTQHGHVAWSGEGRALLGSTGHGMRWLRRCNLDGFPGGVDALLELPALRERLREVVEREVLNRRREQALAARLAQAWPELGAPRELRPGLWLLTHPEKVAFGDLAGNGRELVTTVLVQARPELVAGAQPPLPRAAPPVPSARRPDSEAMRLTLRGDMALAEAGRQLRRNLGGALRRVNGAPVRLARVRVWGNGDRAVLGLAFGEPRLAELYLLARPVYDEERNEVAFADLEFTAATRDYLARTADWMLVPGLLSALAAGARFRFDEELAAALRDVRELRLAAGRDLTLFGDVQRVQPQALYFTRDRLVALLVLEGRLALEARQE